MLDVSFKLKSENRMTIKCNNDLHFVLIFMVYAFRSFCNVWFYFSIQTSYPYLMHPWLYPDISKFMLNVRHA